MCLGPHPQTKDQEPGTPGFYPPVPHSPAPPPPGNPLVFTQVALLEGLALRACSNAFFLLPLCRRGWAGKSSHPFDLLVSLRT